MPKRQAMAIGPRPVDQSETEKLENKSKKNNVTLDGKYDEPSTSKTKETISCDEVGEIHTISKPHKDNPTTSKDQKIEHCSICLGNLENVGKPNACMHKFCSSCIKQWCENHSPCPLCKEKITVIQYNINNNQCDRYPALSSYYERALIAFYTKYYIARRIMNHRTEEEKQWEQDFAVYQLWALTDCDPNLLIRKGYPDLAVPRTDVGFRQSVYRRQLWSIPPPQFLLRPSTPKHFLEKFEDLQRVIQWIKRELSALIQNKLVYNYALNDFINWLKTYRLSDRWFYVRAYEYLTTRTDHFLHELKCFATSSIDDMYTYDNIVQYLMRKEKGRIFSDSITINELLNLTTWDRQETYFGMEYEEEEERLRDNETPIMDQDTNEEVEAEIAESG